MNRFGRPLSSSDYVEFEPEEQMGAHFDVMLEMTP
jgi:hypothetical protein